MQQNEVFLRAILSMVARQAIPPTELIRLITATSGGAKQLAAYNLCDGETPQKDIARKVKLDNGNLSRSISRWKELGILFRVGKDQFPLHIYPVTKEQMKQKLKNKEA